MDRLTYSYDGNQLTAVSDNGDNGKGFADGHAGIDYTYDANGNLTNDLNKSVNAITYNHLNLPSTVEKSTADGRLKYFYDATGCKLRQELYDGNTLKKKTDYIGEFYYENDTLKFINHAEGRIVMTGENPEYHTSSKITLEMSALPLPRRKKSNQ